MHTYKNLGVFKFSEGVTVQRGDEHTVRLRYLIFDFYAVVPNAMFDVKVVLTDENVIGKRGPKELVIRPTEKEQGASVTRIGALAPLMLRIVPSPFR